MLKSPLQALAFDAGSMMVKIHMRL